MRMVLVVAAFLLFGGCSPAQNGLNHMSDAEVEAAMAQNSGLHDCQRKFPKRERGKAAEAIRCVNAANESRLGPNQDLVRLTGLRNLEAAERYDAGKLSETQMDVELAAIAASFQSQVQTRFALDASTTAAQQQAAAAQRQAALQQMMAGASILAGPKQSNTSCSTFGTTMNCRHY